MCLFVHAVVCFCGCFSVTRHMKQRSRADRLRGVRTLAVRHRPRIVALGSRQRSGAFTVCFRSWNDILFVCARTPAELVGARQPSFQKIKCFSCLFSCVPILLHAIVILIALFVSVKLFLSLSLSCLFCFSRSVIVDWQKPLSATTREVPRADLRVLRYASVRACGRRSCQYTWGS